MDMIKIIIDACGSLIHSIFFCDLENNIWKTEKQLLPRRVCSQMKK